MSALRSLLIGSLTLLACEDELVERAATASSPERHALAQHAGSEAADVKREADRLAQAQKDHANLKTLRITSLRAEHSVAASQPRLIQAISSAKPLSPARRTRLDEALAVFRQRLAETRAEIEDLQHVPVPEWERRDDDLGRAMAGLFLARDASWRGLDDNQRDEAFPET